MNIQEYISNLNGFRYACIQGSGGDTQKAFELVTAEYIAMMSFMVDRGIFNEWQEWLLEATMDMHAYRKQTEGTE